MGEKFPALKRRKSNWITEIFFPQAFGVGQADDFLYADNSSSEAASSPAQSPVMETNIGTAERNNPGSIGMHGEAG